MSDIEDSVSLSASNSALARAMVRELAKMSASNLTVDNYSKLMSSLSCKYKKTVTKRELLDEYTALGLDYQALHTMLVIKSVRSSSGIVEIAVVMPPDDFSCEWDCDMCPTQEGMPKSYLVNEPAVARAFESGFDAQAQIISRLKALDENGHTIDKLEIRILGGTFSSYSHTLADNFIRDLYYAINNYKVDHTSCRPGTTGKGPKLSLEEEITINATNPPSGVHVIGLGVETRPDAITIDEIVRFRRYGVTRVELGVQHTNDAILRLINRGHKASASRKAMRLLKDYGFKVEIHIMVDLPGATPDLDKECYDQVLKTDPDLLPDYLKDYPCLNVPFTRLGKMLNDGTWNPYAEMHGGKLLTDVLIYRQQITPPFVRVNRIQRDFQAASEYNDQLGYTSETHKSNLGQLVTKAAEEQGIYCQCIRCREIKTESFYPAHIVYKTHKVPSTDGIREYFIEAVINSSSLLGFIRLRISPTLHRSAIHELIGNTAMIRELHIYGSIKAVGDNGLHSGAQHLGIGRKLLKMAEEIATSHRCEKIAVISGVGVRNYYRSNGYELVGTYMIKKIDAGLNMHTYLIILLLIMFILYILI
jgi:ELP3 family radical SAM enzyme/protein acetyltransferase